MRFFAILITASLAAPASLAHQAKFETEVFELVDPPGYCPLSRDFVRDRKVLEIQDRAQAGQNVVLAALAPCGELEELRAGRRDFFSQHALWLIQAPEGKPLLLPSNSDRTVLINRLSAGETKLDLSQLSQAVMARMNRPNLPAAVKALGLVDKDANGAYFAMRANYDPTKPDGASVTGMTIVERRPISFQLYRSFEDGRTYDALLAEVKAVISATLHITTSRQTTRLRLLDDEFLGPTEGFFSFAGWKRVLNEGLAGAITAGVLVALWAGIVAVRNLARGRQRTPRL